MNAKEKEKLDKIKEGSKIKFKTFKELDINEKDHPSYSEFSGNEMTIRIKFNDGYVGFLKNHPGEIWISENFILETLKSIKDGREIKNDESKTSSKMKGDNTPLTFEDKLTLCPIEEIERLVDSIGIDGCVKELKTTYLFTKEELETLGFEESDLI